MKRQMRGVLGCLLVLPLASCRAEVSKPVEPGPPAPVRIEPPPEYNISLVALSPDGNTLAYGLVPVPAVGPSAARPRAGLVLLCEARTGREILRLPGPDYTWPSYASYSPDGKCLVVENWEKTITLWDAAQGTKRGELRGTTADLGGCLVWSPDGALLAGPADGGTHFWSAAEGKTIHNFGLEGPWKRPGWFAFAADGRTVAVEHWLAERVHPDQPLERTYLYRRRSAVDLWDVNTGKRLGVVSQPSPPVEGYDPPPSRLPNVGAEGGRFRARALPGDRYLLLPTYGNCPFLSMKLVDRAIILSEALTGKGVRRLEAFKGGGVVSPALSVDGNVVAAVTQAAADRSGTAAMVWDVSALNRAAREAASNVGADQLAPLWDALADPDAAKAFPAMRLLALNPGRAVPLLKDRLRPADDSHVARWVADLGGDDLDTREAASRGLAAAGEAGRPALEKALAAGPGPEARRRIEELLEKLNGDLAAEDLRGVRAVDVLEQIGTAPARPVLKDLAAGAPAALTTQAAKDALERLDKSPKP